MKKYSYILLFITGILISSCIPEKRMGRRFVENTPDTQFLVIMPDNVLKESIKPPRDSSLKDPSKRQIDSLTFAESDFVQYIPDSMFFSYYLPEFKKEMNELGLNVSFNKPAHSFFEDSAQAYVFDFAQIQLQEFSEKVYNQETFDGELYYYNHKIDGINLDVWVEFQKANTPGSKPMVLFNEITSRDDVDAHFHRNQITGEVKYSYKIDELKLEEVKEKIAKAGKIHAQYLYDFLMNQYIRSALIKKEIKPEYYLHYDPDKDEFIYVEDERFKLQKD